MRRHLPAFALLAAATALLAPSWAEAGKKSKPANEPPALGWYKQEGWLGDCYNPPDFAALASGPRRMAWQETRNNLMSQWRGARGDGVAFDDKVLTNLETALLAKPERIEQVARDNHDRCKAAMGGKGVDAWKGWIDALPAQLTAGECASAPLDYTLFDYLSINAEWQIRTPICRDDHIWIRASANDYYRIAEKGPWINAAGDQDQPASGDLPCNTEGCYRGQLVLKFTGDSGVATIKPVGTELEFRAPEHGRIEVMINDDTMSDNVYKVESGIEHHTSIEYSPVKK